MPFVLPIEEMTLEEKLRAMEALWVDLGRKESQVESPAWHQQVLNERERRVQTGEETFIDWETAKQQLRDQLK